MPWEIDFLNAIQKSLSNGFLDTFFKYFTFLGSTPVMIALCVALVLPKRTRKIGIQITLALIGGVLIGNLILKNALARPRPFTNPKAVIDAAHLLVSQPSDYSFPSGHTLGAFNAALILLYNKRGWGILALFGAALIAFSRMYLFVHYPTDILAGIALAVFTSVASFTICKALFDRYTFDFKKPPKKPELKERKW